MKVLIIEDEAPAARRLQRLIERIAPDFELLTMLDSIEDAVSFFQKGARPDLIFMDIELSDGQSFSIFRQVEVTAPVIFTTAYDHFALRAFKVNSVDYLLKPIDESELENAIEKFRKTHQQTGETDISSLMEFISSARKEENYKQRFLVKVGEQLKYIPTEDISYFLSDGGYVSLVVKSGKFFFVDFSLDQLREKLDPQQFFQVNRKCLLRPEAISAIHTWFNSRLKLDLLPEAQEEIIVSRDRVKGFKEWLDR